MVEPLDLTPSYIAELRAKISKYKQELNTYPPNSAKAVEIKNSINAIEAVLRVDEQEKLRKTTG